MRYELTVNADGVVTRTEHDDDKDTQ